LVKATIDAKQLKEVAAGPKRGQWIDVRSPSEYATGHLPGAINIPLEQIELRVGDLKENEPLVLICQRGARARVAASRLAPCGREIVVLEGGTQAWIEAGYPVVASVEARWSLERQIRLGAGMLVVLGVALSVLVNLRWIYLAGFIGVGLSFAGLTDICPMGLMLARLPRNRRTHCPKSGEIAKGNRAVAPEADRRRMFFETMRRGQL
jgi:rhodanese-related sulfurtransferase